MSEQGWKLSNMVNIVFNKFDDGQLFKNWLQRMSFIWLCLNINNNNNNMKLYSSKVEECSLSNIVEHIVNHISKPICFKPY